MAVGYIEGLFDTREKRIGWIVMLTVTAIVLAQQLELPLKGGSGPKDVTPTPPPPPPPEPPEHEEAPWPPGTRWDLRKYG